MTVAALCDDYLKAAEKGLGAGQAQTSQSKNAASATDRVDIERHIKPLLGTMAVADVQAADVRRFLSCGADRQSKTNERVTT